MICEVCQQEQSGTQQVCSNCGSPLPVPTVAIDQAMVDSAVGKEARFGSVNFDSDLEISLMSEHGKTLIQLARDQSLVIGRGNQLVTKEIGSEPAILVSQEQATQSDKTNLLVRLPQNTFQSGVSRQHVLVQHEGHLLTVTDLNSTNGSWLNGIRLIPHQKRLLRNGDILVLGKFQIQVLFNEPR